MTSQRPARTVALMLESDGPGGAEYMLLHLAEELRARGYGICPVLPAKGVGWLGREFRARGFEPEAFHLRRPLDWRCVTGIAEVLRRRKVDVVHSHEFTMAVYGAAATRWWGRQPLIVTIHGGPHPLTHWRRGLAFRWAMRRSRATVAVSDATRRRFVEGLGVAPDAIGVVHNGIRPPAPGRRAPVRAELGVSDDTALLVSVGNLYPVKGHAVLLRALVQLAEHTDLPRWRVALAGRGQEAEPLKAFAREHGLAERVTFLGHRDDVPDILAAGDLYVMPSLSEGLPLSLLEALFAEKPVVASAVGGIPEVVTDGESGRLVPPNDPPALAGALAELLRDPRRARSLAGAGLRRAREAFTLEHMTTEYERLYAAP
jgi:glycosyltransferase involved in cell wall biosynthesis